MMSSLRRLAAEGGVTRAVWQTIREPRSACTAIRHFELAVSSGGAPRCDGHRNAAPAGRPEPRLSGSGCRYLRASRQALAEAMAALSWSRAWPRAARALVRIGPAVPELYWAGVSGSSLAGSGCARPTALSTAAFMASRAVWAAAVFLPAALAAAIRFGRLVLTVLNLV